MCTRIHTPEKTLKSVADLQAYLAEQHPGRAPAPAKHLDGPIEEETTSPLDAVCLCVVDVKATLEGLGYTYDSVWDEYTLDTDDK